LKNFNSRKLRSLAAKITVATVVLPLLVTSFSSGASAATLNEKCARKDLFEVAKKTDAKTKKVTYLRCMVSKGSSLHAAKPKFSYQKITKSQYNYRFLKTSSAIRMDGSSTVYPLMAVTAKYFESTTDGRVDISIGISGTGGGFEKFCRGETDMSNASRAISATEIAACAKAGIAYTEVLVANDGLAVVVNPSNPLTCIKMTELKEMWKPATGTSGPGFAKTWANAVVGSTLGDLKLYGAGSDSGTFDSFNTFVHAKSTTSRTDYQATENDNVTVKGVAADANSLGYYGLSYAIENAKINKALQLDKGAGCVEATKANVQNGTYAMSRPLYTYVKNTSANKPVIKQLLDFYMTNATRIADDALFVPLTADQIGLANSKIVGL
jgi:phosphate transport system substrate-binding protein